MRFNLLHKIWGLIKKWKHKSKNNRTLLYPKFSNSFILVDYYISWFHTFGCNWLGMKSKNNRPYIMHAFYNLWMIDPAILTWKRQRDLQKIRTKYEHPAELFILFTDSYILVAVRSNCVWIQITKPALAQLTMELFSCLITS